MVIYKVQMHAGERKKKICTVKLLKHLPFALSQYQAITLTMVQDEGIQITGF